MKKGDKIKVIDMVFSHENYPWIPDLVGKKGEIASIQWFTPVYYQEDGTKIGGGKLDGPIFHVKMNEPFKTGNVPKGEHAFGYKPTEWEEKSEFTFTTEEIEIVSE